MRKRTIAVVSLVGVILAMIALFFVLNMTNPSDNGPAGILLVLGLIYLLSYSFIVFMTMIIRYVWGLVRPSQPITTTSDSKARRSQMKVLAVCGVLAMMPLIVISLNSIKRIELTDVVLTTITEAVAVFYIVKRL